MGKLGVGIGDEFPIDGSKPSGEGGSDGPRRDPDYEARRDEWRKARETYRAARRQWREKWRDEWRERKRAFGEEMRARCDAGEDVCYPHSEHWYGHRGHRLFFSILALTGFLMIAFFIFNHIFVLLGLLVLAALFFAYHRGGFDYFDQMPTGHGSFSSTPPAPPADASKS